MLNSFLQHISKYSLRDHPLLLLRDLNVKIGNDKHGIINGDPK